MKASTLHAIAEAFREIRKTKTKMTPTPHQQREDECPLGSLYCHDKNCKTHHATNTNWESEFDEKFVELWSDDCDTAHIRGKTKDNLYDLSDIKAFISQLLTTAKEEERERVLWQINNELPVMLAATDVFQEGYKTAKNHIISLLTPNNRE